MVGEGRGLTFNQMARLDQIAWMYKNNSFPATHSLILFGRNYDRPIRFGLDMEGHLIAAVANDLPFCKLDTPTEGEYAFHLILYY